MNNSIQDYTFDEHGMTWITCDLCSGSFRRGSQLCALCGGSKLRRVSYAYIVQAIGPPRASGQQSMPPEDGDSKRTRRHGHGRGNKV
ncbi:hypothetical protein B0J13DRAFT_551992 [Dactylonectria estremocensis]|uniref:Uncharacterized protein n=1 Tax=Dactylonectria estremocensis TaxID=1079267 RepID=A0A9P9J644_9HYPO|nr:hypothetical protein B0J13DRAFT_551992 [Dactylonectria estremocensis]